MCFELQTALSKRDVSKANQIAVYFAANPKTNPFQLIIGNLNTWFGKILKLHYLTDRSQQNLARELGVHPFFVKDYEAAGKTYTIGKTADVIGYLREYDLKSKGVGSSGNTDTGDLLKELLFKILH